MVYCIEPKGEFRKILMYTLESCGYTSEAIPSGKELLEVLKQHRPELILLDYDLPGEKGLDILDILRDSFEYVQIPVIMVSDTNDGSRKARCFDHGADDYLFRTMGKVEMMARIRAVLRRAERYQQADRACRINQNREYLYILLLSLQPFEPMVSKLCSTNSHKMYKYS